MITSNKYNYCILIFILTQGRKCASVGHIVNMSWLTVMLSICYNVKLLLE